MRLIEEGGIVSRMLDYPQVTEELLQEVVCRILSVGAPQTIVLFGFQKARMCSEQRKKL
jgi:hypothetical protein